MNPRDLAYLEPLVTIPWTPALDMRRVMIANARACVGMHGGTRESVAAFQALLGPMRDGAPPAWPLHKAYGKGGMSTCAMVALGLLRRAGVACADIRDGYADDIGSGLDVAIAFARRLSPRSAWIRPAPGLRPSPGDVVQVLGPMHVATVVAWEDAPDGALMCVSVDGGQVGLDGLQQISVCRRPWRGDARGAVLGTRRVDGWIDVMMLPYDGPVVVPESFVP